MNRCQLKASDKIIFLTVLFLLFIGISCKNDRKSELRKHNGRVVIKKERDAYSFYKDGVPFTVKGGAGFTYLKELAEAGGNTIKTWDTVGLSAILDEAQNHHLNVIVGLDIPKSSFLDSFYADTSKANGLIRAFKITIEQYKNHPALLAWCVGNELDFPYKPKFKPFYNTLNQLINLIHQSDTNHPVTTTLINFQRRTIYNLKLKVPDLDFISINTFGQLNDLEKELSDFTWFWDGPYLITEWSPKGGWESELTAWEVPIENTSTKKAELYTTYYRNYLSNSDGRCLGSLAFYWGNKEEFTHTWFGVFNEDGDKTEVVESLSDCWKNTQTKHYSPQVEYMLLDGKGAKDNILLDTASIHHAQVFLKKGTNTNDLSYKWEIVKEDWTRYRDEKRKKPVPEQGLFKDSVSTNLTFNTPKAEGPYRIFVTIRSKTGYCATANIPFYVL